MHSRLAVLIDADNVSATCAPRVFSHVARIGHPIVRRVYGRPSALPPWMEAAQDELFEFRPLASLAAAKNGTDISLVIEAMDLLHADLVGAFCIVSNDRDFVPLAIRLRAGGKLVHAICRDSDERYARAFDSLLELEPRNPIVDAFRKIAISRGPEMTLGEAGKLLREHLPGVIPTTGKTPLRKALEHTGKFAFSGSGSATRVRLLG